ncbi:M20/M25/M40 family metallo-hydrolase [Seongchinamella sediminis]|uniref:M20/M25/M40 family metallo-hydrolase n=2 Tax=Seongchinamella sediminis TaxID=2283635 RepID=A0A3L7DVN9_9GAMM|nr:M20/M25/M40 family metallo-hydrolase [Seongchinamella sediminis]
MKSFKHSLLYSVPAALLGIGLSVSACAEQEFTSMQSEDVDPVVIEVDIDAAAKRLAGGVRFPTISNEDRDDFDVKAFEGFHDYLEKTFPNVHKTLKREVLGDPRPYSLLYTWEGKDPSLEPVILMAHQDVVPIASPDEWSYDPFAGTIDKGYLWGRGSWDDKGMIFAILEAAEMKIKEGFQPTRTYYFVMGQDEEVGGGEGVGHIADLLEERGMGDVYLVFDESAPLAEGLFPGIPDNTALIGIAQKGYLSLELRVDGVGGHSSQPPETSNIGILAAAITKLEAAPFPYKLNDALRHQYRWLGPELPKDQKDMYAAVAFGNDDEMTELEQQFIEMMEGQELTRAMLHTTTAVTIIEGGVKANVMPPMARAVVNFRPTIGDSKEYIMNYVRDVIDDERITITDVSQSTPATKIADPHSEQYALIEKTLRQIYGNEIIVAPFFVVGGADAKYFAAKSLGVNTYTVTPLQLESVADMPRLHGVDERIQLKEIGRSIGFYYQLMTNLESQ